ncbi:PA domain-containing protein [Alkalisalibacterium limincola]|uniref:Serine protease n=1 Tax=Alkalisalibacterium limincola TaxID=2699169 RepID=A0A5C8KNA1_9GAMM|nr:PA domain-containing protein [Alkalisalibacterium limincola]TXK62283.1 serine protease [Alkalisalibacterium limincola]
MNKSSLACLLGAILLAGSAPAWAVDVEILNVDPPGAGLNDPTPASPVGGNPGLTVGEQRQAAYRFAADLWGSVLEGDATVRVNASFAPLPCAPTTGVLASAGPTFIFSDFPGAIPDTWYHVALAKAITGDDLIGTDPDIVTTFNASAGQPGCLEASGWYYGFDGNAPPGQFNFLNVVMHEIGHGLGFSGFENVTTGTLFFGLPSIYATFSRDGITGLLIRDITNAERAAAFRNDGGLVWVGDSVTTESELVLDTGVPEFRVLTPAAIAGPYAFGTAAFGPAIGTDNFSGDVVTALSGEVLPTACEPLTNAADVAGNIALVVRGACTFTIKALNAQNAGATGVIVANNSGGTFGMGGDDPNVVIPVISVSEDDGALFFANEPELSVAFTIDETRLRGTDPDGFVQLYAPSAVAQGSSVSHFDTRLDPNALMEPFITASLIAHLNLDLTPALFEDIGWGINRGTARIGNCDTGVPVSTEGGLIVGANIVATAQLCRSVSGNQGALVNCMVDHAKALRDAGLISAQQSSQVRSCTARWR